MLASKGAQESVRSTPAHGRPAMLDVRDLRALGAGTGGRYATTARLTSNQSSHHTRHPLGADLRLACARCSRLASCPPSAPAIRALVADSPLKLLAAGGELPHILAAPACECSRSARAGPLIPSPDGPRAWASSAHSDPAACLDRSATPTRQHLHASRYESAISALLDALHLKRLRPRAPRRQLAPQTIAAMLRQALGELQGELPKSVKASIQPADEQFALQTIDRQRTPENPTSAARKTAAGIAWERILTTLVQNLAAKNEELHVLAERWNPPAARIDLDLILDDEQEGIAWVIDAKNSNPTNDQLHKMQAQLRLLRQAPRADRRTRGHGRDRPPRAPNRHQPAADRAPRRPARHSATPPRPAARKAPPGRAAANGASRRPFINLRLRPPRRSHRPHPEPVYTLAMRGAHPDGTGAFERGSAGRVHEPRVPPHREAPPAAPINANASTRGPPRRHSPASRCQRARHTRAPSARSHPRHPHPLNTATAKSGATDSTRARKEGRRGRRDDRPPRLGGVRTWRERFRLVMVPLERRPQGMSTTLKL